MRYPAECPVFEVLNFGGDRRLARRGSHVECSPSYHPEAPGMLAAPKHSKWAPTGHIYFWPWHLRPLTRAAREMLALVRRA